MFKHFFRKRFFLLSFFIVLVFFSASNAYAATPLTAASLTNAFKSYVTPPNTAPLAVVTPPPTKVVTTTPSTSSPQLNSGQAGSSRVSEAELTTALRNILKNKEFASQLKGAQGTVGSTGPQGAPGGSGGSAMYSSQTAASIQPSSPAPIPVVFRPAGISQPDPAHNFSGATYFSATNLSSNLLTTSTANVTTANVTTLNVTGATTLSGGINGNLTGNIITGSIVSGGAVGVSSSDPVGITDLYEEGKRSPNTFNHTEIDNTFFTSAIYAVDRANAANTIAIGGDFAGVSDYAGRVDGLYGVVGRALTAGTVDTGIAVGVYGEVYDSSSGITDYAVGVDVAPAFNGGGGSITNNYGLRIAPQTVGTNNWNIWSGPAYADLDENVGQSYYNISPHFFGMKNNSAPLGAAYSLYGYGESNSLTANGGGVFALAVGTNITGTKSGVNALAAEADQGGTGNITSVTAIGSGVRNLNTGTITNAVGVSVGSNTNEGGGTITNNYGLTIADQTAGTNNWNIWSGPASSSLSSTEGQRNATQTLNVFTYKMQDHPGTEIGLGVYAEDTTGLGTPYGFIGQVDITGAGNSGAGAYGTAGYAVFSGTGTLGSLIGVDGIINVGSISSTGHGIVTEAADFVAETPIVENGGIIRSSYGFYTYDLNAGTNNYGVLLQSNANPGGTTARTITNVVLTSNVVTVTTSVNHGFTTGEYVTVEATTNTAVNGSNIVIASTPALNTFTYARTHANITSVADTGSVTPHTSYAYYGGGTAPSYFGGSVGINTTTPAAPLEVKGTTTHATIAKFTDATDTTSCTLSSGGLIACSSDERLKKNIENISYGLDTVIALRPVLYNWKYEDDSTIKNLGFIAQDVEALVPKLVSTDEEGMKSLNTIGMIPILTKSIQELNGKVEKLSLASLGIDTNNTWIDSVTAFFDTALAKVENGVAYLNSLVAYKLTIGNAEKPTGFTIYDKTDNQPFCVSMVSGALVSESGTCESTSQTVATPPASNDGSDSVPSPTEITTPEPAPEIIPTPEPTP